MGSGTPTGLYHPRDSLWDECWGLQFNAYTPQSDRSQLLSCECHKLNKVCTLKTFKCCLYS